MNSYQYKLHALPFDRHDELCDKIDEMAKNLKTTGDAVGWAMYVIDRRIKYNEDKEDKRLVMDLLSNIEIDSVVKELEIVPEDDLVTLPPMSTKLPSTSNKSHTRPPIIVEGVPSSKSSPILVETVLSEDDVSEVTILREELLAQRKEQVKVTQAVLDQFANLNKGSKIADKGADMMSRLVLSQTVANFSPIPKVASNTAMGEWMDDNHSDLAAAPWDMDGVSMVDMKGVVLADASKHY